MIDRHHPKEEFIQSLNVEINQDVDNICGDCAEYFLHPFYLTRLVDGMVNLGNFHLLGKQLATLGSGIESCSQNHHLGCSSD